jgi:predicted acetyltransferase
VIHLGGQATPDVMRSIGGGKRRRGYATQALREVLQDAKAEGLRYVDLTARPDNMPSRRVIEANGGVLLEEFTTPAALGGHREVRYRVHLD